jgi:hypothetical protein
MRPTLPIDVLGVHQPKIDFMNQSRSLQGMARLLRGHVLPGETMQFVIHERHELLERSLVSPSPIP